MKKVILCFLMFMILNTPCLARDFIVEFLEENYKETQADNSEYPLIYHSIQVNSPAGPKLLVLTGDDANHRRWLRQYIAANKKFIAKVLEDENDLFISSKAYEIDVSRLHPFNGSKWTNQALTNLVGLQGDKHILVVDANDKRSGLITMVVKKMGYTPTISRTSAQALQTFRLQPEKFKMIIANHKAIGLKTQNFVDQILKIDQAIPIVLETGYRNKQAREKFMSKFSTAGSVVFKSMVLQDLQNTIKTLIKEKA